MSKLSNRDLRITNIIRGQDHLSNTFKHVLIFEALGVTPPTFAHLPLLVAPDGAKRIPFADAKSRAAKGAK